MRYVIKRFIAPFNKPPFQIGDIVRFEPNERALGWTQNLYGLYPGYVGEVTELLKGPLFEWGVYVDNKPIEFASCFFRLVRRAPPRGETD